MKKILLLIIIGIFIQNCQCDNCTDILNAIKINGHPCNCTSTYIWVPFNQLGWCERDCLNSTIGGTGLNPKDTNN
jgi:hypothetical protein